MTRAIVIGLFLVLVFAVVMAPAGMVRTLLPEDGALRILDPAGTIWSGGGDVFLAGQAAGHLEWRFDAAALTRGALGYDVRVSGSDHQLTGTVRLSPAAGTVTLVGRAASAFANRWLAPYDIALSGDLEAQEVRLRVPYDLAASGGTASGSLTWTGGPIRYRLGGRSYAGSLPPLVAYLGDGLEAVVYPQGRETPLLRAELLGNGFVKIGVTQLLTDLAGNPWPGSHAAHDVVLEVEEQVF